ncbi:MAG: DUF3098 domain-containing protein [Paludibacteraceae bacterium]|jgi:formate hydrogenlyase subunit 3/multisubunit Na+/H+ antiporter MnhD subunit|nr:DUF3098 domain-containing protein [Paludibacteraceae bacterium]MDI9536872.1 DUF3098 domain-containing protein [Bacteroidota bacterium]HHT61654.1 DUF3098 domain-containing protein [Bacteroidales bacterium]MBP9039056.1 DUF3098 domain-containing protein [Paludibacteraceae bacterium]HOA46786.1 DUF3098 domain-containing protein [Paludibacteraceae bacterium]
MNQFPLKKMNFILMGIAVLLIILGFVLMHGSTTTLEFNPDIFSFRRITLAPIICMIGFVLMVVAILWKPKNDK